MSNKDIKKNTNCICKSQNLFCRFEKLLSHIPGVTAEPVIYSMHNRRIRYHVGEPNLQEPGRAYPCRLQIWTASNMQDFQN